MDTLSDIAIGITFLMTILAVWRLISWAVQEDKFTSAVAKFAALQSTFMIARLYFYLPYMKAHSKTIPTEIALPILLPTLLITIMNVDIFLFRSDKKKKTAPDALLRMSTIIIGVLLPIQMFFIPSDVRSPFDIIGQGILCLTSCLMIESRAKEELATRIRVKMADGSTGTISKEDFDPAHMEKL